MKKISISILLTFLSLFISTSSTSQVNYCDSIEILISNQSLNSITCTTNTNGMNTFWNSQDWTLTDKYGSIINTLTGINPTFSMPNPINSDTNYICVTSILSTPILTIACNTCDTIVWDGTSWILLSSAIPCITASVYVDNNTSPPMMNASINGMSMYDVHWSNGLSGNQTPYYSSWCVTIIDLISGCDTTICENCAPDTTAICACPMIYMPVCGCDGNQYVNYCHADCAGVGWTPATPSGMPGGFLPCPQPNSCIDSSLINPSIMCPMVFDPVCGCNGITYSNDCEALNWYGVTSWTQGPCSNPCTVDINNGAIDIEICDGDTAILEVPNNFDTYIWTTSGTSLGSSHILHATTPGIYMVVATNIQNNCVDIDSIEVIVHPTLPLNPVTAPDPPMICLGDSIVIEVDQGFIGYWWNTGNPNDIDQDRVVVYPAQDFTYVVEAIDDNGCESREEIQVFVDTCATNIQMNILDRIEIYPNPANKNIYIHLPGKQIADIYLYNIEGRLIYQKLNQSSTVQLSRDNIKEGIYILRIHNELGCTNRRIIFKN